MAYIRIPSMLKKFTDEQDRIKVEGKTIKDVLFNLLENFPDLKSCLFNEAGQLSPFVNIYVNSQAVHLSRNKCLNPHTVLLSEDVLADQDELIIIPALQGG